MLHILQVRLCLASRADADMLHLIQLVEIYRSSVLSVSHVAGLLSYAAN